MPSNLLINQISKLAGRKLGQTLTSKENKKNPLASTSYKYSPSPGIAPTQPAITPQGMPLVNKYGKDMKPTVNPQSAATSSITERGKELKEQIKVSPDSINTVSPQSGVFDPYTQQYITNNKQVTPQNFVRPSQSSAQSPFSAQAFSPQKIKEIANSKLSELQKQYAGLQAPTAEEQALQNQLTQFLGQAQMGISGLEGQGRAIPLSLIRGQQGKLAEQANLQAQTIQGQLSNAQQARQAQQEALGLELGFEQDRVAQEQEARRASQDLQLKMLTSGFRSIDPAQAQAFQQQNPNAQVFEIGGQTFVSTPQSGEIREVGDSLIQVGPDGSVNVLYTAPQNVGAGDGFSLSPGQTRYDAFGNVLAQAPGNTPELTQAQQKNAGFFNRAVAAEQDVQAAFGQGLNLAQAPLPNLLQSPAYQRYRQAGEAWIKAILRQESGAAIPPEEINSYFRTYFPTFGDSQATIEQKARSRQEAIDALGMQSGQQAGQDDPLGIFGGSFKSDLGTSVNGLGSLSERYESGGNPGAIGYDSTGGYSYGAYQLAHNNAKRFIEQSPYAQAFQGLRFNSPEFRQRWQQVAQQDPQGFKQAQKAYIQKTHFDPQIDKLQSAGINASRLNPVVLDAIWSTAVQHGPNTNIVVDALKKAGNDPIRQIQEIYKLRWSGGKNFASSTPQVRSSVFNRFFGPQGELNLAISKLA